MCVTQVYASFQPKAQPHKRATCSDMLKALDAQEHGTDLVILDARGREQYTGQVRESHTFTGHTHAVPIREAERGVLCKCGSRARNISEIFA